MAAYRLLCFMTKCGRVRMTSNAFVRTYIPTYRARPAADHNRSDCNEEYFVRCNNSFKIVVSTYSHLAGVVGFRFLNWY